MATACLREDRWLVHHLACDLPVAEVTRLALDTGASLVVLSATTSEAVRRARQAAAEIRLAAPGRHVLAGQPGDTLSQLRALAREADSRSARTRRQPGHDGSPGGGQPELAAGRTRRSGRAARPAQPTAGGTTRRVAPWAA